MLKSIAHWCSQIEASKLHFIAWEGEGRNRQAVTTNFVLLLLFCLKLSQNDCPEGTSSFGPLNESLILKQFPPKVVLSTTILLLLVVHFAQV
jgi:hypothetical protein